MMISYGSCDDHVWFSDTHHATTHESHNSYWVIVQANHVEIHNSHLLQIFQHTNIIEHPLSCGTVSSLLFQVDNSKKETTCLVFV